MLSRKEGSHRNKVKHENMNSTEPEKVKKRCFGCILKDEEEIFMKHKGSKTYKSYKTYRK